MRIYFCNLRRCGNSAKRLKDPPKMVHRSTEVYKLLSVGTVLISCDKDNEASRRTILNNGGKLQREFYSETFTADVQMYEIDLS